MYSVDGENLIESHHTFFIGSVVVSIQDSYARLLSDRQTDRCRRRLKPHYAGRCLKITGHNRTAFHSTENTVIDV